MRFKRLVYFLPILIFLIFWELISRYGPVDRVLFPPPSTTAFSWCIMLANGTLLFDIKESLWRLIIGLLIGGSSGVFIGLLTGRVRAINSILTPLIQIIRPLPPVAIIPLVIIWLGIDNTAKIFTITFGSFFPLWISAHIGAGRVPQIFLWTARTLKISKIKLFWKVILPATSPFIFTGVRTSLAVSFAMIFVSEIAGASSGIGYRIAATQSVYRIDQMMAALATLAILGAIFDQLIVFLAGKISPWLKKSFHEPNHN